MGRHEHESHRANELGGGPEGPNVDVDAEGDVTADLHTADAELTEEPRLDPRDPAGSDDWLDLDAGAGVTAPRTHQNWRPA